jgi:regulation of enolase protein 1 (concanavalin A-like superfamily)
VEFASDYDAGVLFLYVRDDVWAKLCFEYSPQHRPMVVSVVTRGTSDDCNSVIIDKNEVYLRIFRSGPTFAYHYSTDGKVWHMVRYFTLGELGGLRAGFEAQSPTGKGCAVVFSEVSYRQGALKDIRSGE